MGWGKYDDQNPNVATPRDQPRSDVNAESQLSQSTDQRDEELQAGKADARKLVSLSHARARRSRRYVVVNSIGWSNKQAGCSSGGSNKQGGSDGGGKTPIGDCKGKEARAIGNENPTVVVDDHNTIRPGISIIGEPDPENSVFGKVLTHTDISYGVLVVPKKNAEDFFRAQKTFGGIYETQNLQVWDVENNIWDMELKYYS